MDKNNELYEKALDVLAILGISPLALITRKKLESTFDIYELMDETKQRAFYDYKKLEYYACDIENYLEENFHKEYEENNLISQADINKMALLMLYNFDSNLDFNTIVENTVKTYLKENHIIWKKLTYYITRSIL